MGNRLESRQEKKQGAPRTPSLPAGRQEGLGGFAMQGCRRVRWRSRAEQVGVGRRSRAAGRGGSGRSLGWPGFRP